MLNFFYLSVNIIVLLLIPECGICDEVGPPELYCTTCDPKGFPYHKRCWEQPFHRNQSHQPFSIRDIEHLRYINEPNTWTHIDDKKLKEDNANCFVEYDTSSQRLRFGPRAFPLLHYQHDQGRPQNPSFVSFVGRTGSGKSFLLRALQDNEVADKFPSPIPAPGRIQYDHTSTSHDINLYADSVTAGSDSPILFLDCEGFEGSDQPSTHPKRKNEQADMKARREFAGTVYPRLVYAFSTCIVFVTEGSLKESSEIGRKLVSYASRGASASENQGFKPSLLIIFNRFRDNPGMDFNWSIESSTKAFLEHEGLEELKLFYDTIHVIYIPCLLTSKSNVALEQINAFQMRLRETYQNSFQHRQHFRLTFTPDRLMHFLWRALELFSDGQSVFDWSIEASGQWFTSNDLKAPFQDLWTQCARYHAPKKKIPQVPQIPSRIVQ